VGVVAKRADALLVLTEWNEFKRMDYARVRKSPRYPIIIDGRNLLKLYEMRNLAISYSSIGRPDVIPSEANICMSVVAQNVLNSHPP
jgi:UDPglucose 6-dehydrogenase